MKIIVIAVLALLPFRSFAQKSMTFQKAQQTGIFAQLDKKYRGGLNQDSSQDVFRNRAAYIDAYQHFILDLSGFLHSHGFRWGKQVRCFNKVYFSQAGRVDYFLYNFKPGVLTPAQEAAFSALLAEYLRTARFKLLPPAPFAQCSPVQYSDNAGK